MIKNSQGCWEDEGTEVCDRSCHRPVWQRCLLSTPRTPSSLGPCSVPATSCGLTGPPSSHSPHGGPDWTWHRVCESARGSLKCRGARGAWGRVGSLSLLCCGRCPPWPRPLAWARAEPAAPRPPSPRGVSRRQHAAGPAGEKVPRVRCRPCF